MIHDFCRMLMERWFSPTPCRHVLPSYHWFRAEPSIHPRPHPQAIHKSRSPYSVWRTPIRTRRPGKGLGLLVFNLFFLAFSQLITFWKLNKSWQMNHWQSIQRLQRKLLCPLNNIKYGKCNEFEETMDKPQCISIWWSPLVLKSSQFEATALWKQRIVNKIRLCGL